MSDDVKGEFNCKHCEENEQQGARNCDGNTQDPVPFKVYGDVYFRCPLKLIDSGQVDVVNVVSSCEGGGMAVSRITPSQLFNETGYYVAVRRIILSEQGRVEKWKRSKEEQKREKEHV